MAMTVNGALRYLHADQLGSTVLTTYTSGARESERGYYAFGSDRRVVGTPATDHRFTGQKVDGTGLYYYNARYYDPVIGQFVSPDTIVPEPNQVFAYNRYMYVMGNPLRYNDPSGHCQQTPDDDDAACWHALQRLLHSPSSAGIYTYDEAKAWDVDQIEMLTEFWSQNDFAALDPDGHIVGVSGGFRLDTPLGFDASGRVSLEYLYNFNSREHDLFVAGGGSLDFDLQNLLDVLRDPLRVFSGKPQFNIASAQGGVYLGDVFDLPENGFYVGRTTAQETAFGLGPYSATSGSFQTPGDPSGPHGNYIGWTPSVGINLGKSAVHMNSFRVRDIRNAAIDFVNGD